MTAPALDVRAHMTTLLGIVDASLGEWSAYRYGELDDKKAPHIFALVSVERRYVTPDRGGRSGYSSWRALVRYVGRTALEAEWAGAKVGAGMDGVRFTVDGRISTPAIHESTSAVRPDEGRFSGESVYTYTL